MNKIPLVVSDPVDVVRCLKEVSGGIGECHGFFFSLPEFQRPNSLDVSRQAWVE